jgi:hypothetical protein
MKNRSLPLVFSKKFFQLSVWLRMSDTSENWLNTVLFQVILETPIPCAVLMDSVSTEFAAVIHYQFPHGKKLTISIDHLIQDQFAIRGI